MVVHVKNHSELFISKDSQSLSKDSFIMTSEIPKLLKNEMDVDSVVLGVV